MHLALLRPLGQVGIAAQEKRQVGPGPVEGPGESAKGLPYQRGLAANPFCGGLLQSA